MDTKTQHAFPSQTKALNAEYQSIIDAQNGAVEDRRKAWAYMNQSTAIFDGIVVYTGFFPKIFDQTCLERLGCIAETTYGILQKVMDAYRTDAEYRKVFGFDPRMEALICLPKHYDSYLPFGRIDLFLNEETGEATFCEFNADGSSGMNENREAYLSIKDSAAYREFAARHNVHHGNYTFFEGWVEAFLRIYRSYYGKAAIVEHPHIAILDYLENSVLEEFKIYAKLFEAVGCTCSVYDVRNVTVEDGRLIGHQPYIGTEDAPIDVVWRRFVSNDILTHWDESGAFLQAANEDMVPIIGSFAGHIVHDKRLFEVLRMPETKALLTDRENAFVEELIPPTKFLSHQDLSEDEIATIISNPNDWIIKPPDGYGSWNVYPGPGKTQDEWAAIIDEHIDGKSGIPYLIQRFCHPYKTPALPFYDKEEDFTAPTQWFNAMEGLFLIDGKFSGVYTRLGPNPIIRGKFGGITQAALYVDADEWFIAHGWRD